MRRFVGTLAALLLLGLAPVARPQGKDSLRFEPIQVVSTVEPRYPAMSIAEGTVILQVTVEESGKIRTVRVIQDVPSLTGEAKLTVQKWKFKPAKIDGKAVTSTMVVAFYFGRPVTNSERFQGVGGRAFMKGSEKTKPDPRSPTVGPGMTQGR